MPITLITAGLLALMFFWLSRQVILGRWATKVSLGTGENDDLERRIRVHGNFAEYAPFILLMIALLEASGAPAWAVGGVAGCLLAGRALHAIALSSTPPRMKLRVWGMGLTFAALILGGLGCLALGISAFS